MAFRVISKASLSSSEILMAAKALCILIGYSTFILRLPGALMSFVTLIFGTLIIKERFGKNTALMGAALLTIMPYFIMQSRFALDCNLLLGAVTASVYLLIYAVKTGKTAWFAISGVCFGLSLYAYALSYFILPMFLLVTLSYLFYIRRIRFRHALAFGAALLFIGWPLIAYVFIDMLGLEPLRLGPITIQDMEGFRGKGINLNNIAGNFRMFFNSAFFKDPSEHNAFEYHYTLYIISIPFSLFGLVLAVRGVYRSAKERVFSVDAPILALLFSVFCLALCLGGHGPYIYRLNAMYFCLAYLTVYGIRGLYRLIKRPKAFLWAIAAVYAVSLFAFAKYYFLEYPSSVYPQPLFYPDYRPVLDELDDMGLKDAQTYFMTPYGHLYYSLAAEVSPYEANFPSEGALAGFASIGNKHFFQPGMPDADSVYITWAAQENFSQLLYDIGFTGRPVGGYIIFTYED